ncbi:MAG: MATE family efflux transporter, partial [Henriciella sp.]
ERFGQNDFDAVRDACRLGVFATFAVGFPMSALIWLFRDSIALILVAETAQIDGYVLAPAISALLVYAALATTFDGLQATASMALRAQEIVWLPTLIHVGSFFAGLIPGAY